MNSDFFYLKLRANIKMDGDVDLAQRELQTFFRAITTVDSASQVFNTMGLPPDYTTENTRKFPTIGFIASGIKIDLKSLVMRLNFIQEIWTQHQDDELGFQPWIIQCGTTNGNYQCIIPFMALAELLSQLKTITLNDAQNICISLSKGQTLSATYNISTIVYKPSSTLHVHSLHKYKAKFFPRMIRSYLVSNFDALPHLPGQKPSLLDPFVGSGTSLVEASLLGINSVGLDIDPLSCAISKSKVQTLKIEESLVKKDTLFLESSFKNHVMSKGKAYTFPPAISNKFLRWNAQDEKHVLESEISRWLSIISFCGSEQTKQILEICFSDALSRKFNIRMMGTGVGRFALEISPFDLTSIMFSNLRNLRKTVRTCRTLSSFYHLDPAETNVLHGDATNMPFPDEIFSVILTSPPYLPASSGREDYLVGKQINITALNMLDPEGISLAEESSIGSMKSNHKAQDITLPDDVYHLYKWLMSDSLRQIKAAPILSYYQGLAKALAESKRVLLPTGLAIFVIGKESLFYSFHDRKVLYRVDCAGIFRNIALSQGFTILSEHNVELDKSNKNARPRGLDSYFETVFILRKPEKHSPFPR